jgi:hypothetical protein
MNRIILDMTLSPEEKKIMLFQTFRKTLKRTLNTLFVDKYGEPTTRMRTKEYMQSLKDDIMFDGRFKSSNVSSHMSYIEAGEMLAKLTFKTYEIMCTMRTVRASCAFERCMDKLVGIIDDAPRFSDAGERIFHAMGIIYGLINRYPAVNAMTGDFYVLDSYIYDNLCMTK